MRWISVEDKLPDLDQVVMVCYPSGYDGSPIYTWGARMDDSEGWCWGVKSAGGGEIRLGETASWNQIEVDDDYQVQFWQPLDDPPALTGKTP